MDIKRAVEAITAFDCHASDLAGTRLSQMGSSGLSIDNDVVTGPRTEGIDVETMLASDRKSV